MKFGSIQLLRDNMKSRVNFSVGSVDFHWSEIRYVPPSRARNHCKAANITYISPECLYDVWRISKFSNSTGSDSHTVRPWKNEDTLWRQHCVLRCCVHGKMRQHCCVPRGHKKCFWRFSETYFVPRTQNLCRTQMLRASKTRTHLGNMITSAMLPPQCVLVLPGPNQLSSEQMKPRAVRI